MVDMRRAPDAQALGLMLVFCLTLGFQQVAIKLAAPDVSPVFQLAIRYGFASVLVWLYMRKQDDRIDLAEGNWKPGLFAGVLFAAEFLLVGESLRLTAASHTVVFLYTSPIFAALLLHILVPAERMSPMQWLGISLAFVGIALAFLSQDNSATVDSSLSDQLLGDALAILAGALWGATTVLVRTSRLAFCSPRETLLYQLIVAFVVLTVAAILMGQSSINPTLTAIASIGFQTLFVAFFAFLLWFWLLRHYQASPIGVLSFMTPLFGVLLSAWILSEPLYPGFVMGSVLVLLGLVLVTGSSWLMSVLRRKSD